MLLLDPRRRRRDWQREQAAGLDGEWLTVNGADGGVCVVAPPGVALGPRNATDAVRWRIACWPQEALENDLLGAPPADPMLTSLAELLAEMPRRIAAWSVAQHRAAQRQQAAAAVRARAAGDRAAAALASSRADALAAELCEALREDPSGAGRPARETSRAGRPDSATRCRKALAH